MFFEINQVSKVYHSGMFRTRHVHAVDHVSLSIDEGEIMGLIGESGCGKSTLTKIILGLLKPTEGTVCYQGRDLTHLRAGQWKSLRKEIQCVFQHPQMTFNPKRNLYYSCAEPLRLFHLETGEKEKEVIRKMTESVGVPYDQLKKYPHEISGGQAQRLAIARALALSPKLLLCDEPTSMLDVSVQAQVLQMLLRISQEKKLAMLFISHDLEVVEKMCSRVAVMQKGRIIETGSVEQVFHHPQAEYTKKLLEARIQL